MPFRYRLDKILNFRIRKKDEQLDKVRKAQMEVSRVEGMVQANLDDIANTRINMKNSNPMMYSSFDNYLQVLYQKDIELQERKKAAIRFLQEQMNILQQLEQDVKVLEKHKEKKREEYNEEQKQIEMKMLNEVGSQRHFARTRDERIELEEEMRMLQEAGINIDE